MINILIVFIGKFISKVSKTFKLGNGSTWPGHIALKLNPDFIKDSIGNSKTKIIFITGTNGKTTTAKLIKTIFEENGKTVFVNKSGANLLNGIASSLILEASFLGKISKDYAIFEIDENALTGVSENIQPDFLIALNLFRDQLDRYGEVDTISKAWEKIYEKLKDKTTFILNADDPRIAYLGIGKDFKTYYFGLDDLKLRSKYHQQAADSILCPKCYTKLNYSPLYYSHLGNWSCPNCKLKRPKLDIEKSNVFPLKGVYNMYNVFASGLLAKKIGIDEYNIDKSLKKFKPAFGRQEEIVIENKKIKFFLAKNPTSFNESLRTINELNAKNLLIILNDRIPDGTDVSWIWDTNAEEIINNFSSIVVSGDRCFDMALRLRYAISSQFKISNLKFKIEPDLKNAINIALEKTNQNETLYILPTYSAMLDTRKLLTGKKIL